MGGSNVNLFLQAMRAGGCDPSLVNLNIGWIGLGRVQYSNLISPTPQGQGNVVLISGSLEYIQQHSQLATNPMLALFDDHIRGKVGNFWIIC
jgi:hypothetical protein